MSQANQPTDQGDEQLARLLGAACRTARGKAGITQVTAAARAGITPEFYGRVERGDALPRLPTLMRIAAALDAHPGLLLGDKRMLEPLPAATMPAEGDARMLRAFSRLPAPMRGAATRLVEQLAALFPGCDDDELIEDLDWMARHADNISGCLAPEEQGEHEARVASTRERLLARACVRLS